MQAELQSMATQTQDRSAYLRLAETLSAFLTRMRSSAKTLDVTERQRIVRLLVKEILVGEDTIIIRHSVPVTSPPPDEKSPKYSKSDRSKSDSYLLRSGRDYSSLRRPRRARDDTAILHLHRRLQPTLDVEQHPTAIRMVTERLEHQLPIEAVEGRHDRLPCGQKI